uniref:Uncharacterized protein n=1 Tax=Arundo donax TaxID=35708 RepID=A0A0A9DZS9_ARUDO
MATSGTSDGTGSSSGAFVCHGYSHPCHGQRQLQEEQGAELVSTAPPPTLIGSGL